MKKSLVMFILVFVASCKNAYVEKSVGAADKVVRSASDSDMNIEDGSLIGSKCDYINEEGVHERDILVHDISPAEVYVHEFFELEKEAGPNRVGLATPGFNSGDYQIQVVEYDQREDYGPFVNIEKIESEKNIEILYYVERDEYEIVEHNSEEGDSKVIGQFINCEKGYEFDFSLI